MVDHRAYFADLISGLLCGRLSRAEAAAAVASTVGVDEIAGDRQSLLANCEWALRHADEPVSHTTDAELIYLLTCLQGHRRFSEADRDAAIAATPMHRGAVQRGRA